jgi:hypothetical protein
MEMKMRAKKTNTIYEISYRDGGDKDYSTTLEAARAHLAGQGYKQTQSLNIDENEADIWEKPETEIFVACSAKIISIAAL